MRFARIRQEGYPLDAGNRIGGELAPFGNYRGQIIDAKPSPDREGRVYKRPENAPELFHPIAEASPKPNAGHPLKTL